MGVPVMWIALEQVERVRAELAAFPVRPVDKVPCKQAIGLLSPQIRELRVKGYSRKEIAEALTAKGLPVSETVLRSYERGADDGSHRARGGRGRKAAAGSRSGARVESVVAAETKAPVGEDKGRREAVPVPVGSRVGVAVEDGAGVRNGAGPRHGNAGGEAAAELRGSPGGAGKGAESAGMTAVLRTEDDRESKFALGSRPEARLESVGAAETKAPVGQDEGRREAVPVPVGKRAGVAVEDGAGARNGAAPCHGNAGGEAAAELRRSPGEAGKVAESAGKGAVLSTDDERKSKFEMRKDTEDL